MNELKLNIQMFAFTRVDAQSIVQSDGTTPEKLTALWNGVIENYEATSKVARIKNKTYSGDPMTGSVIAKRFANATAQDYGTARTAGEGNKLKGLEITIPLDTPKEIIEEFAMNDVKRYGVPNLIARRFDNFTRAMRRALDRAFYAQIQSEGTDMTADVTYDADMLEMIVQIITKVETIQNDYVDGIDRELINIALAPAKFNAVKKQLDKVYNSNTGTEEAEIGKYAGVNIYSEHYLPAGVDYMVTVEETVAQPVASEGFPEGTRIPLSNDYAVELYFDYGTKVLANDLNFYGTFPAAV